MTYNLEFLDIALKEWRKLSPALREQFKKKLAERLGLPMGCVSVKATTTEGLGFEGEEKGISAHAVCLLADRTDPVTRQ